jgi:hypothetical protein
MSSKCAFRAHRGRCAGVSGVHPNPRRRYELVDIENLPAEIADAAECEWIESLRANELNDYAEAAIAILTARSQINCALAYADKAGRSHLEHALDNIEELIIDLVHAAIAAR